MLPESPRHVHLPRPLHQHKNRGFLGLMRVKFHGKVLNDVVTGHPWTNQAWLSKRQIQPGKSFAVSFSILDEDFLRLPQLFGPDFQGIAYAGDHRIFMK